MNYLRKRCVYVFVRVTFIYFLLYMTMLMKYLGKSCVYVFVLVTFSFCVYVFVLVTFSFCVYMFVFVTFSFSFCGWGNLGVCFRLKCRSTQEVEGKYLL